MESNLFVLLNIYIISVYNYIGYIVFMITYPGRTKLFLVGEGRLGKNIGHHVWPTTKNFKKTMAKTP